MKYLVNNEEMTMEQFWNKFEKVINDYADNNTDAIDDIIDDMNEVIHIGSLTYYASDVLKNTDPVAYRCYISDMVDAYYSDYKYEIETFDRADVFGDIFEIIEDESEAE